MQQKLVESRETAEEEVVWAIVDGLATEGFSEFDNTGSSQQKGCSYMNTKYS